METHIHNLSYTLETLRETPRVPESGPEQARRLHELSRNERMLAIALLLGRGDTESFFQHLRLSGEAHARLLTLARDTGLKVRFAGTGNYHPFCNALAAGQDALARELARLSPEEWMRGVEYEEDFVHGRFLHFLVLDGFQASARQQALLERMAALDPEPPPQQRLCRALFEKDSRAFADALADAVRDHIRHHEELEATRFNPTAEGRTEPYVFIEGLALLRLAATVGLQTEPEHRLMPSLARWKG
jgi:hypothetical protein